MKPTTSRLLALAGILSSAVAQFVPAPTDLITKKGFYDLDVRYKQVPDGICELTPGVKSYSGEHRFTPGDQIWQTSYGL